MKKWFLFGEVLVFSLLAFIDMHKKIAATILILATIGLYFLIEFLIK